MRCNDQYKPIEFNKDVFSFVDPVIHQAAIEVSPAHRALCTVQDGFSQLVSEVAMGHVGIVSGLEVSRLARNNADRAGDALARAVASQSALDFTTNETGLFSLSVNLSIKAL